MMSLAQGKCVTPNFAEVCHFEDFSNHVTILHIKGVCTPCNKHFKVSIILSIILHIVCALLYPIAALITFIFYRCCYFRTRIMAFTMNILSHQTLFQRIRAQKRLNPFSCGRTQAGKIVMPRVEEVRDFPVFILSKQQLLSDLSLIIKAHLQALI